MNLGIAFDKEKKYKLAINTFNRAYILSNKDPIVYCYLISEWVKSGFIEKAEEMYEQLTREFPNIQPNDPLYFSLKEIRKALDQHKQ